VKPSGFFASCTQISPSSLLLSVICRYYSIPYWVAYIGTYIIGVGELVVAIVRGRIEVVNFKCHGHSH
jgi:hypothetical protein